MKKIFQIICVFCLIMTCGCASSQKVPEEKFAEIFDQTSDEELFMWVPDLERIDYVCKESKKQFSLDIAAKLKNDVPLSEYDDEKIQIRKKAEALLKNLRLKEADKFYRHRILLRIGCEQEEKDFLVIYDDMMAVMIHIDKDHNVKEEYYEVESVADVEEFLEYIDSLYVNGMQ